MKMLIQTLKMQEEQQEVEKESLMIYLKKELEESLARNETLEKENRELKQETIRLKAQIASLKAHDNERKSMLWKKLQSSNAESPPQERQPPHYKVCSTSPAKVLPQISCAPPPPPPPLKVVGGSKSVRRVPEVVELYRLVSRKNANMEKKSKTSGIDANAFQMNMIGEIENRSTHLSAVSILFSDL